MALSMHAIRRLSAVGSTLRRTTGSFVARIGPTMTTSFAVAEASYPPLGGFTPATRTPAFAMSTAKASAKPAAESADAAAAAEAMRTLAALQGNDGMERPAGYHLLFGDVPRSAVPDGTLEDMKSTMVPLVVYENGSTMLMHRLITLFLTAQTAYWSYATGVLVSAEIPQSIIVPSAAAAIMAATYIVHSRASGRIVKSLTVTGPQDPLILATHRLFGQKVSMIPRSSLTGLDPRITTPMLAQSKYLPLCVAGSKYPYVLPKDGMFDLTGVLDPILGFNPTTYRRCFPTPAIEPPPAAPVATATSAAPAAAAVATVAAEPGTSTGAGAV